MANRNQQPKAATTQRSATRWESDGACRCDSLKNVWGGRTTHYESQCQDERERTGR